MDAKTIFTIHAPRPGKLVKVIQEMRVLGAPTIRVVVSVDGGTLIALEGCHRLAAACELRLAPKFVVYDQDDPIDICDMDIEHMFPDGTTIIAAGEAAHECYHPGSGQYRILEDGMLELIHPGLP
jgi:hypothetical protein